MFGDAEVSGYEIRHGRLRRCGGYPLFTTDDSEEGCRVGSVFGTSWHGVMESDGFRRNFLRWVAEERGLDWTSGEESFAKAREARLEKLGDLVAENVDREALLRLVAGGVPEELPVVSGQLISRSGGQKKNGSGGVSSLETPSETDGETLALAKTVFSTAGDEEPRSKS